MNKSDLKDCVMEALVELGGSGTITDISKVVWRRHEPDLRSSGDLFYTWQYDIRWAGQQLRDAGVLKEARSGTRRWELASLA